MIYYYQSSEYRLLRTLKAEPEIRWLETERISWLQSYPIEFLHSPKVSSLRESAGSMFLADTRDIVEHSSDKRRAEWFRSCFNDLLLL